MNEKSIAIIGASSNPSKYGNKAVKAWKEQGYKVFPVNPKEDTIESLPCYKDILDIPEPVSVASLYLPPKRTLEALDSIAQKGVEEVYLNPGTESEEVVKKAEELGLNIIQACSILAVGKNPNAYE